MKSDLLIIGGGLAGLFSAAVAAKSGRKVHLLTYGAGTLTIGGGIIDVLGYDNDAKPLKTPEEGLEKLSANHPYQKIGKHTLEKALEFFKEISIEEGYEYIGELGKMQWLPTAAGTLKPTCLVPKTMDARVLWHTNNIYVVGFDYLKDFYPQLVAKNLQKVYGPYTTITAEMCSLNFAEGRDVSSLDVARWLDTKDGREIFIKQLKNKIKPKGVVIVPPILGTLPNYEVLDSLERQLDCRLVEAAAMPPAVTGLRLRMMLLSYIKKLGVTVIEKALVTTAITENGHCTAVVTDNFDRQRAYQAHSYILANGGLYGGGLKAEPGKFIEPIFNLPINTPATIEEWSNVNLFSDKKQLFAEIGVEVDELMRPVSADGATLLSNVHVAGRNLSGYDFCYEKSGNGVALASAYKAAISLQGRDEYE
ncbi:anaerobic glycerol-3-phosphate dehydrogenase subunit GlpB [Dendrosporobacter sp. 1207_IL3150]|uniref:anaerobic glycerol-3-phosphate dehydrogenase subunit GlpB n=1 Tax=Dendrosporobacter sp. 1207_IL3150 TaxID=3084054 RepID=UPI002FDA094F